MDPATKHLVISACVDVKGTEKESQWETELPSASPADSPVLIRNTMINKENVIVVLTIVLQQAPIFCLCCGFFMHFLPCFPHFEVPEQHLCVLGLLD